MLKFLLGLALISLLFMVSFSAKAAGPTATPFFGNFEAPIDVRTQGTSIDEFIDHPAPLIELINVIVRYIIVAIVAIALITIVIAGYVYMTAGGNGDRVKIAKQMIFSSLGGILLALGSFAILELLSPQFASNVQEPTFQDGGGGGADF